MKFLKSYIRVVFFTSVSVTFCSFYLISELHSQPNYFSTSIKNGDLDDIPVILPAGTAYTSLYIADGTSRDNIGAYSHHPHIIYYCNVLYATWSNHLRDEDGPGQRILMRTSDDLGETWFPGKNSMPIILFPSLDRWIYRDEIITENNRTGTSNGFALINSGKDLYAINEVLPCGSMQEKGNGRLARRIYPDGTLGEIFWLEPEAPPSPQGFPSYPDLSNPKYAEAGAEIIGYLNDKTRAHLPTWDFKGLRNTSAKIEPGNPGSPSDSHSLCEPTTSFKINGNGLAMFWRDLGINQQRDRSFKLYASYSLDKGDTWSVPEPTSIPDACSRPCAGNLPNGTAFLVNNPGGFGNGPSSRKILTLSLASDTRNFKHIYTVKVANDTLRYKGKSKGSFSAAYPNATIVNMHLFIIYSINKEDIEICRIYIPDILKDL